MLSEICKQVFLYVSSFNQAKLDKNVEFST